MSIQLISGCSFQRKAVPLSFLVKDDEKQAWNPLIEQFNAKHPKIEIHLENLKVDPAKGTDQLKQKLLCALGNDKLKQALNCPPNQTFYDLLYLDIIWVPEFVKQGWLMDLTKEFPYKELKNEFLISELENGCYEDSNGCEGNDQDGKGKLYRVPFRTDIGLLYYRKDLLEQVKAKPPKTFDDLKKIAEDVQKKQLKTNEDFRQFLWPGQGEALIAMFTEVLHGYGGYWIQKDWISNKSEKNTKVVDNDNKCQQDKCKVVALDDPQAIQAVQFLYDTIYSDKISSSKLTELTDPDPEISEQFNKNPDAVFMRNWPFAWAKAYESESLQGKIDFIPMVHAEAQTSGASKGGWGFGVAKNTKHPKEAIEAIKFFTSAPIQRQFTLSYGSVPSLRKLFLDPQIVARYRHYPKLLSLIYYKQDDDEWIARPRIPQYKQASCILQKYLDKVLNSGDELPNFNQVMNQAAKETRKLLDNTENLSPEEMLKCE
ncbi:extracellular solute-binding protein [Scytonema sp. PCC 10023]|uniref:extracellular solute-binding protein n=1 Tax=Scytonema sp. PCC 10023 TaxID=1680591 RepID=UPI0039C6FD24